MKTIDAWVLQKVEYLSHRVQELIGYDCFVQARFCHVLCAGFVARLIIRTALGWLLDLILLLCAVFYLCLSIHFTEIDDWRRKQAERGFRNPAKVDPDRQITRAMLLLFSLISTACFTSITNGQLWFATLSVYLSACDPCRPPE